MSLYSLNAKIKMLFFAWLTPVVRQISQEFCINNTCPHQQPKCICPTLLFSSLFTIIYDPITEKHFKSVSGKIQRCFQEYVICDYPEKWPRTKTNSARSYSMQWRKIYYLFFSRKCPYIVATKIIRRPSKFLLTF